MKEPNVDTLGRVSKYALAFLLVTACLGVVAVVGTLTVSYFKHRHNVAAERAAAPMAAASQELRLARFTRVEGTPLFRARLVSDDRAENWSSYKGDGPSRNLLFANSDTGTTHWLLKDNDHEIVELEDLPEGWNPGKPPPRVTVVLVKPRSERPALATGDLLLLTPTGDRVVKISEQVRSLAATSLLDTDKVSVVYERDHKFFMTQYTIDALVRVREQELVIPKLK